MHLARNKIWTLLTAGLGKNGSGELHTDAVKSIGNALLKLSGEHRCVYY